ncbi:MAG: MraY family glycosyltransferase [Microthrixaceae bacterium]
MIRSYAIVLAVTTLVTAALVPLMVRLAGRLGAIAIPNDRKVHATPTPTLGGGAMFIGMLAGVGVASTLGQFDTMFESWENIIGVVVGAFVIFMTGVIDDIREVSAPAKVAGIVLAGSILALAGISIVNVPLPIIGFTVLSPDLAALVTVLWVLVMANAVNLIDGLDGLAAGLMAIACRERSSSTASNSTSPGRCSAATSVRSSLWSRWECVSGSSSGTSTRRRSSWATAVRCCWAC